MCTDKASWCRIGTSCNELLGCLKDGYVACTGGSTPNGVYSCPTGYTCWYFGNCIHSFGPAMVWTFCGIVVLALLVTCAFKQPRERDTQAEFTYEAQRQARLQPRQPSRASQPLVFVVPATADAAPVAFATVNVVVDAEAKPAECALTRL